LHRDIKPGSILLDYDFNVKLAGFTLSLLADWNSSTVLAEAIGTRDYMDHYMDPQCMKDGLVEFNRKSDVYSFGIVLLEIATGRYRGKVWDLYRRSTAVPEMMKSAADPELCGVFEMTEMESVIVLGLKCSDPDSRQRPYMVDAMKFLEEGIELPALALRPSPMEFLTNQTTCPSVLSKRTTCENICQKRPPENGGTFAQATRGTCRLGQSRQGAAATDVAGRWPGW
jgi:serine/threonine protein kinase